MTLFADKARTDRSPREANETMFGFLNRTGSRYFEPMRDLLEAWVSDIPAEHHASIVGSLSSGDDKFESALWELYIYKVASGSADRVEIHPEVAGTPWRPDFLVHGTTLYYLEAIAVGCPPEQVATERRLREVEAVLDRVRVDGVTLNFEYHQVGAKPISAAKLRDHLLRWIDSLDVAELASQPDVFQVRGRRPTYEFTDEGWHLTFEALPTTRGTPRRSPLIGVRGEGRAKGVDNKTGLRRALDAKVSRCGTNLPYPW